MNIKQRVRSLQLLEEKENEIKALKTSFEICVPTQISEDKMHDKSEGQGMSLSENCHMIHYANEIARKDVEISSLRKSKYAAESALRQALQDKITSQEELHDRIQNLEEQVDRLERCKTREGANLEYLKNVFVSFLSTRNLEGKRHMINAIGAVLQFTPSEIKAINSIFQKDRRILQPVGPADRYIYPKYQTIIIGGEVEKRYNQELKHKSKRF
uniref:GRIP domain-containing protein n=1 Tax=Megaselia scalaris TaxID=36166 RepID=T1GF56_MEGSC